MPPSPPEEYDGPFADERCSAKCSRLPEVAFYRVKHLLDTSLPDSAAAARVLCRGVNGASEGAEVDSGLHFDRPSLLHPTFLCNNRVVFGEKGEDGFPEVDSLGPYDHRASVLEHPLYTDQMVLYQGRYWGCEGPWTRWFEGEGALQRAPATRRCCFRHSAAGGPSMPTSLSITVEGASDGLYTLWYKCVAGGNTLPWLNARRALRGPLLQARQGDGGMLHRREHEHTVAATRAEGGAEVYVLLETVATSFDLISVRGGMAGGAAETWPLPPLSAA